MSPVTMAQIRRSLEQLRAAMPAPTSNEGAAVRNARRLASIAEQPEGPARRFVIDVMVTTARNEEPEDFAALLDAIDPVALGEAFPGGLPQVFPDPFMRARARAWKTPPRPHGFHSQS
jgi:hypothetical protein